MMFTCHCLNVALEADLSQEPEPLDAPEGLLGDQWQMGKVQAVTRAHPSLTRHVQMGQWRVERCLNCGQYTHATTPSRPGRGWLNAKLLDERAADDLKSSDLVSAIFHVVINPNGVVDVDARQPVDDGWYGNVEGAVNDLNGAVSCYVGREQARIEEEIRTFSEQQYEQLNNLKEKAMKEGETLVRNAIKATLDLDPPTPKSPTYPAKVTSHHDHDSDVMLMFPFEEFDHSTTIISDDDVSDDDDVIEDAVREGVAIPRPQQQQCGVAKSCPVDIPNYVPRASNRDVVVATEGNAAQFDIAANIKALAKSVHGDAIFGELPRPKFSTQI